MKATWFMRISRCRRSRTSTDRPKSMRSAANEYVVCSAVPSSTVSSMRLELTSVVSVATPDVPLGAEAAKRRRRLSIELDVKVWMRPDLLWPADVDDADVDVFDVATRRTQAFNDPLV